MKIGFKIVDKTEEQTNPELGTAEITEEENDSFWNSVHSIITSTLLVIRDTFRLVKSGKKQD